MGNTDECDSSKDIQTYCTSSYGSKVEFALKLGYNEQLLQTALCNLGSHPTQDKLLSELIRLGAQYKNTFDSENCIFDTAKNINIFIPVSPSKENLSDLRSIVIDGSNVAISHGNKEIFSCRGIKICVDWFKNRGHKDITVFVPKWRKESFSADNPIKDQDILKELEKERLLVFTPSRFIGSKRMICYDDRYILKLAAENHGIVVSNDNYRDLLQESSEFKKVIEERLLMFSFVNDIFMPPDDPLGRLGPNLDNFLRIRSPVAESILPCPYGKKCTYGNKCKFYHLKRCPGKQQLNTCLQSVHPDQQKLIENVTRKNRPVGKSRSMPLSLSEHQFSKEIVCRTKSIGSEKHPHNLIQTQSVEKMKISPLFHEYTRSKSSFKNEGIQKIETSFTNIPYKYSVTYTKTDPNNARIALFSKLSNTYIDESINHHKKLQRNLYGNNAAQQQSKSNYFPATITKNMQVNKPHIALKTSISCTCSSNYNQPKLHENVVRISSAPAENLADNAIASQSLRNGPNSLFSSYPIPNTMSHLDDQRRKLFYHLSSIFPVEYVKTVMEQFPEETESKKICAGILKLLPKI